MAIDHHIPLITNPQKAQIMLQCLIDLKDTALPVHSWREISRVMTIHVTLLQGVFMTKNLLLSTRHYLNKRYYDLNEIELILRMRQKN